jgi:hypothetical protein
MCEPEEQGVYITSAVPGPVFESDRADELLRPPPGEGSGAVAGVLGDLEGREDVLGVHGDLVAHYR